MIESVDEPWFEDARVKTCVTILQRCSDDKARSKNMVKFVRLQKPLAVILGDHDPSDETARQEAATKLRKFIESAEEPYSDEHLRIIPVSQQDLWNEGVEAGKVLANGDMETANGNGESGSNGESGLIREAESSYNAGRYVAGKWGRFLRAPDIYFKIMKNYGERFVKLGEIAEIRRRNNQWL